MNLQLAKGTYVVAVSGGIDSVVLLDMLSELNRQDYDFIIAHFDHGIRADSKHDAELVDELAKKYDMPFVGERAELGAEASENTARTARYNFLRRIYKTHNASAILTAHHQDDLLETMALNICRGTGRNGLTPMLRTYDIVRPLLQVKKAELISYANVRNLKWNEDSTNDSDMYTRNRIRALLYKKLKDADRDFLVNLYTKLAKSAQEIDDLIKDISSYIFIEDQLVRQRFVWLPFSVQCELVFLWLEKQGVNGLNKKLIYSVVIACKTLEKDKKIDLDSNYWLMSDKTSLKIVRK